MTRTVTDHIEEDKTASIVAQSKQQLTIGKSLVSRGLQELSEFRRRDTVRPVQDQSFDPKDAVDFSSRADAYYDKGEFESAIQDYNQAIRLNPNSAAAFNNRGLAYVATGQFDQAIEDYDHAIRLNPTYALAFCNRGIAYGHKGHHEQAIKDYDQAIKRNPACANALYNRGVTHHRNGQFDRAIQDYDQVISLNPDDAGAFNSRGNAYSDKKDYDRAIQDYDQAIRLNPHDAAAFYNRGSAYDDKREFDRAIQDYDRAIRINPIDAATFYNRGIVYDKKGEYDRAIQDYAEAIRLDPKNSKAVHRLGLANFAKLKAKSKEPFPWLHWKFQYGMCLRFKLPDATIVDVTSRADATAADVEDGAGVAVETIRDFLHKLPEGVISLEQIILADGTLYTSAFEWHSSGNKLAAVMEQIKQGKEHFCQVSLEGVIDVSTFKQPSIPQYLETLEGGYLVTKHRED